MNNIITAFIEVRIAEFVGILELSLQDASLAVGNAVCSKLIAVAPNLDFISLKPLASVLEDALKQGTYNRVFQSVLSDRVSKKGTFHPRSSFTFY